MSDIEMKLEHFFIVDARIKKELLLLAPSPEYSYDMNSLITYYDKLYEGVKDIEIEVTTILKDLNIEYASDKVNALFKVIKSNLTNVKLDYKTLENIYKVCLSNMNENTVSYIKSHSIGYTNMSLTDLLDKCTSLNEILHAIHSYVMNNENILQRLPKVDSKSTKYDYPVTLYGTQNELSNLIYNSFPLDSNVGYTDIVSLDKCKKVIMMIRDLGHALSIEIDENRTDITVRYHIPKLCNIPMINKLKGINKVPENSEILSGANGMFVTTKEELTNDLFTFISMVPTDDDMEIIRRY